MSAASAAEYAAEIAAGIIADCEAGTPFGVVSDDNPVLDRENGDEVSALDWLSDVLDIQYLVSSDGTYRHARICIAFGGPTAWVDTRSQQLEVAWWSAWERVDLPAAFCEALDSELEQLWSMRG